MSSWCMIGSSIQLIIPSFHISKPSSIIHSLINTATSYYLEKNSTNNNSKLKKDQSFIVAGEMVKKSLSSSSLEKKRKSSTNGGGIKKNNSKHVNRGAWSAEEDKKLADYVMTHGDKRWRSLPSEAGLNRCGKSCRLRWLNYLRPGIKRGNITEDEEDLIIRLHNLLGNRWSLIAGRLPGRTDNEIKNHWNTHLSKKSLTINELNLKLNQKLDDHNPNISNTNTNTPSVFLTTTSSFTPDWSEISHPFDQTTSNRRDDTDLSNPMNGYLDEDLDFNGLFDFSVGSDFPESDIPLVSSSELTRVQDDYNLLGEQMYHKYFDSDQVVVQGTSTAGSLDEDFTCNRLDFEELLYSENIDDDVFLSFS